jgi:hypothetical protein
VSISKPKRHKRWLELLRGILIPIALLVVVLAEHYGIIDYLRGLDRVKAVADNFSLSYAPNASTPVYPDNAAWEPLLSLIKEYSSVKLEDGQRTTNCSAISGFALYSAANGRWEDF